MTETYRRGQVEWALWRLKAGMNVRKPAPAEFLSRIKRLLDVNRQLDGDARPRGAAAFAFTVGAPAGRGEDASFTALDALMLWLALEMLELGFKQQEVTEQARLARPLIARELTPLLSTPRASMEGRTEAGATKFTYKGPDDKALRRFLVLSRVETPLYPWAAPGKADEPTGPMLLDPDAIHALVTAGPMGKLVIVPAALPAFELGGLLAKAPLVKRGPRAPEPK